MKVNLVVAQGVHSGKVIPINGAQFLIGRDPHCNLRPSSASVSKQHCGIFIRDGKVFLQDYGSTNGTSVNSERVVGEREVSHDDKIAAGPLEFILQVDASATQATSSARPVAAAGTKVAAAAKTAVATSAAAPTAAATAVEEEHDSEHAAALLMAMDDGDSPTTEASIPDGATTMDIPSMPGAGNA